MKKQIKLERGIRARFLEGVINQKEIIYIHDENG